MRLTVSHTTTYTYEPPRRRVLQSHRLTPRTTAAQRVLRWTVASEGARFGAAFEDGAGNAVSTMTVTGPVSAVTVEVTGQVDTKDTAGVLGGIKERIAPEVYLRETGRTAAGIALRKLSEKLGPGAPGALEMAHKLCELVADEIAYVPGATSADMTAGEVVELGKGVCQDQAQVMIAIARLRGTPARYVSGYMFDDADAASEASHAWAELLIDGLGWVGFDPANRRCPDERYIRLSCGLDALDAAPIRGISVGQGGESMEIRVRVAEQSQQ